MKAINYKKFLKNTLSLFLTLLVMSNLMDFIRKPTVPEDINATALYDLQGNPFFLPQLAQDKPTIVYFWGTWCGYCRYTSPTINALAKEGYPVVSIALRSGSTTVNDPHGALANQWGVNVTPTIILLHQGKMDLTTTGWTSYWGLKVRLFLTTFL